MQRLSAIDAITPALARTNFLFFKPFRWGRSWKLAASSYLALLGSIFVPVPLLLVAVPWNRLRPYPHATPIILAVTAMYTLILVLLFWLGIRMEFVEFGIGATATRTVAPLWRQFGPRTWPWFWLKVLVGTVVTLFAIPFLVVGVRHFVALVQSLPATQPGNPDPAAQAFAFGLMSQIMTFYAVSLLFFLVVRLAATILHDFVLPFYLLEPAPLGRSLQLGWQLCRQNLAQVLGFLGMKYLLGILGFIAQYTASIILMIPGLVVVFLLGLLGTLALHALPGGPATKLLTAVGFVLLYLLFLVYVFYCQIFTIGYLLTFLESYGLYFTGSRYSRLGELLEPSSPILAQSFPPPPPAQ